jgi:hypothetical protein
LVPFGRRSFGWLLQAIHGVGAVLNLIAAREGAQRVDESSGVDDLDNDIPDAMQELR